MGKPSEDLPYNQPNTTPTRLTDGAAGYGESSGELTEALANEYLRSMAEMCIRICKNTSGDDAIERMVILFGSIERNAVKAERARIIKAIAPLYRDARDTWLETYDEEEGKDEKYAEMKAYEKVRTILNG